MCYNIAFLEKRQKKYAERYKDLIPSAWNQQLELLQFPQYYFVSGFSHPHLPVITHSGVNLFEWGLIPSWIKDTHSANDIRNKTLNAVGETVFEKPSFRKSIITKRCLLGVSGFYEWREFSGKKYPYFITAGSDELFSLGCIYDSWTDKSTGEIRNTFSILTTAANHLMEQIHITKKRMPLILKRRDEPRWTDPTLSEDEIHALIHPFPAPDMKAFTVGRFINNARNQRNIPESLLPVNYNELPELEYR